MTKTHAVFFSSLVLQCKARKPFSRRVKAKASRSVVVVVWQYSVMSAERRTLVRLLLCLVSVLGVKLVAGQAVVVDHVDRVHHHKHGIHKHDMSMMDSDLSDYSNKEK